MKRSDTHPRYEDTVDARIVTSTRSAPSWHERLPPPAAMASFLA